MAADRRPPTGSVRAGARPPRCAAMLADRPTIAERVKETGTRGEGGDRTLVIDEAAEDVVFAELDGLHAAGRAVHRGQRGARRGRLRRRRTCCVVIDPIDGSLNAKRGLPHYALSIAVADGPTMADVTFGFVQDFGPDEEWVAWRGARRASSTACALDPTLGERRTPRRQARGRWASSRPTRAGSSQSADALAETRRTGCARSARSRCRCARSRRRASTHGVA